MAEAIKLTSRELDDIKTNAGGSLLAISQEKPILLVFLRHLGCIFCREALKDIGNCRKEWGEEYPEIILVHMETNEVAEPYFIKYGLEGCLHIEDVQQQLYRRFGLSRGSFSQLFGFKTMVRGFQSGINLDQLGGRSFGDAFQMPGVFVIHQGQVVSQYVHKTVSDRPDYQQLLNCCIL